MISSPPSAENFNVVMLYDNLEHVGKAMATYSQLAHELETEFKPDLHIWRMDMALSSEFSAQANHDIEEAEVIIMAVRGNEACPAEFRHWKDGAADGSGVPHRAIIAILESDSELVPAAESWNSVLRGVATEIHPELFVCEPPEAAGRTFDGLHADEALSAFADV